MTSTNKYTQTELLEIALQFNIDRSSPRYLWDALLKFIAFKCGKTINVAILLNSLLPLCLWDKKRQMLFISYEFVKLVWSLEIKKINKLVFVNNLSEELIDLLDYETPANDDEKIIPSPNNLDSAFKLLYLSNIILDEMKRK